MLEPPPPSLGNGRYVIERQLGAGGMGAVFLCRDTVLNGRRVAVKVLTRTEGTHRGRFRREARLMASLRHGGLIDVYDVCLDGPEPYIVQEYVDGADLAALLARSGPLSRPSSLRLARELAETLAYLHVQGVVHRDLKPTNVMIQPDGRSRLADLGLALADSSTRLTQEGTMLGTVLYMPPEAARGEELGPPADVFSFGLVIWEAATGRHPLGSATTVQDHLLRLLTSRVTIPEPPPDLPPELAPVLKACLRVRPEDRPADGAALVRLLAKGPKPPSPSPLSSSPTSSRSSARPRSRPRWPAAMALLALTLALAGLGVLGLARRDTAEPSPSSPPPALAVPAVASLLDGIRLSLPSPPPEGTRAELRSMDGTLLVERPMRGTTVVLKPPRDTTGDLRWAIRAGTAAREGVAPVGPRLLFDAATHAPDPSVPNLDVPLPPFFHDGRLVMGLTPTTLFTLRPTRRTGQPLTLDLLGTRSLPVRAHPGRPAGSRGVARSRFAIADLAPLGPHTLLAGLFGTPGTFLTLDVDPSVEAVVATMKGHEVVDTLAAPMPGGGCVMAGDLMVNSAAEARRQVILAFSNGPGTNPGQGILTLEGRTPLGLAAMDADTVLLAYEGPSGALASVLRTDGTTVSVVASLDLGFQAPPWRDETHAAGLTLSGGGAALALADRLVVARPDGRLSVRTLDLGPRGRVGLVTPSPDGSLVLVVCRLEPGLAASLSSVGTLVLPLAGSSTPPGEPTLLTRPTEHVDDILPLGQLPTSDGGVLVWCCGTLYDTSGPPLFTRSRTWTLDTRAGWLLAHDGAAFIVTTKGRVYGFDLERP